MINAMSKLLLRIPEYEGNIEALVKGAEYFGLQAEDIEKAAQELPLNHDLDFKGVRMLLAVCLEEFAELFSASPMPRCEVTVPAPQCFIMALQNERDDINFCSSALFTQIVLRGIFLSREPIDMGSCSKRRCGMNKLREKLNRDDVLRPSFQIQFGVLCDECVKTGEMFGDIPTRSIVFPKEGYTDLKELTRISESFADTLCKEFDCAMDCGSVTAAIALYTRMLKAFKSVTMLNNSPQGYTLSGNSFTLAQTVQLMVSRRMEKLTLALETLAEELRNANANSSGKRIYCYYVPFLQPEIDRRFRENGVQLIGNAAFLECERRIGTNMPGIIAAWVKSLNVRAGVFRECENIAAEMKKYGCSTYLTGMFSFDRWMGAATPLQRKLLSEHGIDSVMLDSDFWCENVMFGSLINRIDNICMRY